MQFEKLRNLYTRIIKTTSTKNNGDEQTQRFHPCSKQRVEGRCFLRRASKEEVIRLKEHQAWYFLFSILTIN